MNPPPNNRPLTIDLLRDAVDAALAEANQTVPFTRLLVNETRWRSIIEEQTFEPRLFIRGIRVIMTHPKDLRAMLESAFSSFDYCDHSAFLAPDPHYDQSHMMELDFGFETTRRVEELLRGGKIIVEPCEDDYQYWYTARVIGGENRRLLYELLVREGYRTNWRLRGDIQVVFRSGSITIVGGSCTSPADPAREISALLRNRYGICIDTSGLRKHAEAQRVKADRLAKRAEYLENLPQP